MSSPVLKRAPAWAALAAAATVAACGMPGAPPPATSEAAAEAPPELLGGPDATVALAVAAAPEQPAPARRPGWGTMAPIPNPDEPSAMRASAAPYRLVGPDALDAGEPVRAQARAARRERASRPPGTVRAQIQSAPSGWTEVGAGAPPPLQVPRGRIRHWIVPVAQR